MTRKASFIVALVGAALVGSIVSSAEARTSRRGEWQLLPTGGGKVGTWVYREIPEKPHALTGTLERSEPAGTKQCRNEWRQIGSNRPNLVIACTPR